MTPIFSQMILSQAETQVESAAETAAEILQETLPVAQEVADAEKHDPGADESGIPAFGGGIHYNHWNADHQLGEKDVFQKL